MSKETKFNKREQELINTIYRPHGDKEQERLLSWVRLQNIEKPCNSRYNDWTQLIKGKINGIMNVAPMPFQDHARLYQRVDGTRVFISQPYYKKTDIESSTKLHEWAAERGLEVTLISEDLSWHLPGSTVLFQIEVKDEDKYLAYIREHRETSPLNISFIN